MRDRSPKASKDFPTDFDEGIPKNQLSSIDDFKNLEDRVKE